MDKNWGYLTDEMEQVEYLQAYVLEEMWAAANSTDTKYLVEFYHHYYALMEKQHILWTRITLMNNSHLKGILIGIDMVCDSMGRPAGQSTPEYLSAVKEEIKATLFELTGDNPDDYDGVDVDFKWS